jgi:hypothetical protein
MDFAASKARLSASGVDTSGLGAPLRTQMPMPVLAMRVGSGRTLPWRMRSSSAPLSMTITSAGSPPRKRRAMPPDGPKLTATVFPVSRSNFGTRSSMAAFMAVVISAWISAACAELVATIIVAISASARMNGLGVIADRAPWP